MDEDVSYTYDAAGNRTDKIDPTSGTTLYTIGLGDRLATYGRARSPSAPLSAVGSYAYDTAGNVTRIVRENGTTLDLAWNSQYQLVSVATNGVFAESYAYDALGRRVSTTTLDGTIRHIYDNNWQCIADIDENNTVVCSYVWGEGIDNLLAVKVGGNAYYPLTDIQGTVWGYVDSANNVVAHFDYDAWGNILASTSTIPGLARNRYRFQGREWSAATGLMNFRMRWYDAETGRWLSKDPIGLSGGLNLYVFCGNDTLNCCDPLGFSRVIITDIMGGKVILRDPSLDEFKETIAGYGDKCIEEVTIYDHGWSGGMNINGAGDGVHISNDGRVVFDDDETPVADLLRPKMKEGGSVVLSGCLTAYEGRFNKTGKNVSKALSSELRDIKVTGNRGMAFGNKIGPTWNCGINRTYVNGVRQ